MNSDPSLSGALEALKLGQYSTASRIMDALVQKVNFDLIHYLAKGLAELGLKDWAKAVTTFDMAVHQFPKHGPFYFNLGIAYENLGRLGDAATAYEASIALVPTGEAYGNLSNTYRQLGRYSEAEICAQQACGFETTKAQAFNSLGLALGKQGKFPEAKIAFGEALKLLPNNAAIHANRANLAIDSLDFTSAWLDFSAARTLKDDAIIKRDEGMARLLAGNYAQGWGLFEARFDVANALRMHPPCPRYQGEDLSGKKLMLIAEQGFGDTIMFCRYGKFFVERGAKLVWVVQKSLQRLLAPSLPGHVLAEGDMLPIADYYLPLMSAPFVLNASQPVSEILLNVTKRPLLPNATSGRRKIGLVWSGSKTHERDHERSIDMKLFTLLIEAIDADFYAPSLETDMQRLPITRLDHLITDFADTAGLLKQLDCLITVDTATAHLAGTLGIKTYLLLPYCPDWRWGVSGMTTSWYSSITLVRQSRYGDWPSVLKQLIGMLA
jgi:tetratricopeptide (TPR) repeat protein